MQAEPSRPLRVWLLTDVFPPGSGGSGWSTYYLGKALAERGHCVYVMRPVYGDGGPPKRLIEYEGLLVEQVWVPAAPAWTEQAGVGKVWTQWQARRRMTRRARRIALAGAADVLHGQHALSAYAACVAATMGRSKGAKVASVATVRDYWPLCPVSTRLFTRGSAMFECTECHRLGSYLDCVRGGTMPAWRLLPLAVARWLQTWRASRILSKCDGVVAVSGYVRRELARSRRVPPDRLHAIPNLVDLPSVDRALAGDWPLEDIAPDQPFMLFVGKWDLNKGPQLLLEAVQRSGVSMPVVLAGDGPLRRDLEREAKARGLDFRFLTWLDNDAAILLMRHASALLFPSAWQEPLSRVLLEGCAAGAAIVALDTGGTRDVIEHGESGWLASDMAGFSQGIRTVMEDWELAERLRTGARRRAEEKFAAPKVSARVEALYCRLLEGLPG